MSRTRDPQALSITFNLGPASGKSRVIKGCCHLNLGTGRIKSEPLCSSSIKTDRHSRLCPLSGCPHSYLYTYTSEKATSASDFDWSMEANRGFRRSRLTRGNLSRGRSAAVHASIYIVNHKEVAYFLHSNFKAKTRSTSAIRFVQRRLSISVTF